MVLTLDMPGMEVAVQIKTGQDGHAGFDFKNEQQAEFIALVATILAKAWLDGRELRQAA